MITLYGFGRITRCIWRRFSMPNNTGRLSEQENYHANFSVSQLRGHH